jgi:ribosomal protein S1
METNPAEVSQSDAVSEITQKQHFTGKVIKITLAGAIVDIGVASWGCAHFADPKRAG